MPLCHTMKTLFGLITCHPLSVMLGHCGTSYKNVVCDQDEICKTLFPKTNHQGNTQVIKLRLCAK